MFDFSLNNDATISQLIIGEEKTPLIIIDDFANEPEDMIAFAAYDSGFSSDKQNFYPGSRKLTPQSYSQYLRKQYFEILKTCFGFENAQQAKVVTSALAIADTPVSQLKPIQMLPHFDTTLENQLAVVHYLCDKNQGGTSFFRHEETGFERIHQHRLVQYGTRLKQQAIAAQLHKNPCYMNGSNELFTQFHHVDARMNRTIIYPSNILHSGNIHPELGLSSDPRIGRLTIGSFILFS